VHGTLSLSIGIGTNGEIKPQGCVVTQNDPVKLYLKRPPLPSPSSPPLVLIPVLERRSGRRSHQEVTGRPRALKKKNKQTRQTDERAYHVFKQPPACPSLSCGEKALRCLCHHQALGWEGCLHRASATTRRRLPSARLVRRETGCE